MLAVQSRLFDMLLRDSRATFGSQVLRMYRCTPELWVRGRICCRLVVRYAACLTQLDCLGHFHSQCLHQCAHIAMVFTLLTTYQTILTPRSCAEHVQRPRLSKSFDVL